MATTLKPSRKKQRLIPAPLVDKKPTTNAVQQEIYDAFSHDRLRLNNVDWVVFGWIALMHVGAIAAPFYFTWVGLATFFVLHWLSGSIGICLGYHRYLSHKSMKLATPARFFTLFCGALSGEGSPLFWAATHRLHHQRSDHEGDPHSPTHGPWWSHMFWLFAARSKRERKLLMERYVPDLVNDPMMKFFEVIYFPLQIVVGVVLYAIGEATGVGGMSLMLWGLCARVIAMYHSTWFVNSATHIWGYRNYESRDLSRNLWWVAILAYGEGWHNNHHAHPSVAPAGHKWWELDPTWWAIKTLRFVGLATDVKDRIPTAETPVEG